MKQLLSEAQVQAGVRRLAAEISAHYDGRPLTIIGVLTGSVVLLADLIRLLDMPLRVGVVQARSYRGAATTPGALTINAESLPEIRDCEVLLIDDIFDTGQTLDELFAQFGRLSPRSLRSVVLLRKLGRSRVGLEPDHVGFEIPDEFVVGYGLDYRDAYRNLPYVAALEAGELVEGAGA
ncbi:MAG TPA: hypoxanthine phosphoribosyltransferase [Pirellulales bacterium]|nr:hypoxanthine phosphoribosyltransferase [Pirellulales bacterium]